MNRREELQRWIDDSPFGPWWGLQVELDEKDAPRVRLPFRPEFQRPGGVLQGACVTVVADVAMWLAIIAAVEGGENAATIHLATDYLEPARGDIIGTPHLLKVGRRIIIGSVDTRAQDGTLVAVHRVTYSLPSRRP